MGNAAAVVPARMRSRRHDFRPTDGQRRAAVLINSACTINTSPDAT